MKKFVILGSVLAASSLMGVQYGTQANQTSTSPTFSTTSTDSSVSRTAPTSSTNNSSYSNTNMPSTNPQNTTATLSKDRFTSTDDHKLGSQIRVQMAEVIGAPKANDIMLIIDQGDVKLVGKVASEDVGTKLVQSIQQIKGVKSVHNKLEVEKNKF